MPQYATIKTRELSKYQLDPAWFEKDQKEWTAFEKKLAKKLGCKSVTAEVVAGGKGVKITCTPDMAPDQIKAGLR